MIKIERRAGMLLAGVIAFADMMTVIAVPAEAAPSVRAAKPAASATVAPATAGEADVRERVDPELAPGCQRTRRKLFVESEGWIVRRVTICH